MLCFTRLDFGSRVVGEEVWACLREVERVGGGPGGFLLLRVFESIERWKESILGLYDMWMRP